MEAIQAQIDDGEIPEDLAASLDAIEGDFNEKVAGIVCLIRHLITERDGIANEVIRLDNMCEAKIRKINWLRNYLQSNLERCGLSKAGSLLHNARIQKNSQPSVEVTAKVEELAPDFQRWELKANKQAILEAFNAGEALPEGVKVTYGSHLRIS